MPVDLIQLTQDRHDEFRSALHLAIAALIGLAVGIEREWSGRASGPQGRFAGLRTFLLLGVFGGAAGLLLTWGYATAAAALLLAGALFAVSAYVMAVRRPDAALDGTTEGAALVVVALGALAGIGDLALAAGAAAVVVFALGEKERLHWLVRRIGEREMRAALRFAVMALVVLPLLPEGPYGPLGGVRPRTLWALVLLFSGLNFAGYLARRAVGVRRAYEMVGLFGGLVSSTALTLQFARLSVREPENDESLARGVVAACTVVLVRVALIAAMLDSAVAATLLPVLLLPVAIGSALIALGRRRATGGGDTMPDVPSPLRFWSAIQMAVLLQVAITGISVVRDHWGATGILGSAAILGVANMDALTVSMIHAASDSATRVLAAQGIAVGALASTLVKLGIAVAAGAPAFRRRAGAGIAALVLALAGSLVLL